MRVCAGVTVHHTQRLGSPRPSSDPPQFWFLLHKQEKRARIALRTIRKTTHDQVQTEFEAIKR